MVVEGEETIESLERDVEVRSFFSFARAVFVFFSSSSSQTGKQNRRPRASRSFFFSHRCSLSRELSLSGVNERARRTFGAVGAERRFGVDVCA